MPTATATTAVPLLLLQSSSSYSSSSSSYSSTESPSSSVEQQQKMGTCVWMVCSRTWGSWCTVLCWLHAAYHPLCRPRFEGAWAVVHPQLVYPACMIGWLPPVQCQGRGQSYEDRYSYILPQWAATVLQPNLQRPLMLQPGKKGVLRNLLA